jgi:hypothetical protein
LPLPRPQKELVAKTAPLLTKIVGAVFVTGGVLFLTLGLIVCLYPASHYQGDDPRLLGMILVAGSVLQIATGVVVFKYVGSWMLRMLERKNDG